jgi:hypothetical protein
MFRILLSSQCSLCLDSFGYRMNESILLLLRAQRCFEEIRQWGRVHKVYE